MAHATQLNATEQDTLVKQIGLALLRTAPRDWQRITAHYRTVGRYHELEGEVTLADGTQQEWVATQDIASLFHRLRAGMYREERGTWFNAHYQLDAPASYNLEYDREEPRWQQFPPPQAYSDELRMFPRTEENIPEWLMERLAGVGPGPAGPHFRFARIFDGTSQDGRPVIDRQELTVAEQDRMLTYLGGAPVVLPGRGYDVDRLAPAPEPRVPVAFHSDGTWIWPAAVNYYLQEYGIAPEAALVEHIRNNRFQVPRVTDEQRAAAHDYLTKGDPGSQQQTSPEQPPAAPAPRAAGDPGTSPGISPAPGASPGDPGTSRGGSPATTMVDPPWRRPDENGAGPPDDTERTQVWQAPADMGAAPPDAMEQTEVWQAPADLSGRQESVAEDLEDFEEPYEDDHRVDGFRASHGEDPSRHEDGFDPPRWEAPHGADGFQPPRGEEPHADRAAQAAIGTQYFDPRDVADDDVEEVHPHAEDDAAELAYPDEPAITRLRTMLAELRVPSGDYRIGEPATHCWSIEQVEHGWRVGWYDDTLTNPSVFGDAEDAAAFMLGKLLLEPSGSAESDASADTDTHNLGAPEQHEYDAHPEVNGIQRDVTDALSAPPTGISHPAEPQPTTVTSPAGPPSAAHPAPPGAAPTMVTPSVTSAAGPDRPEAAPTTFQPPVSPPAAAPEASGAPSSGAHQAAAASSGGAPSQPGAWPIQPLPGEPPLTLFRGKQLEDLPIGSEIDRFGNPDGNLTYIAGTPFEERSLVPEWVNRPYHVYRVQRPIEALSGLAIPWFSQPGGGAAYILPAAIEDLVADGVLIELDPGEPPID